MGFSQHKLTTNYTQILSEYIRNTKYEDLPPEVVERAKIITTQVIGVALAAKDMGETKKAIELAKQCNAGGGGEATAWVDGSKLSLENACMLNGTLADMLDWEDCSCTGHPSCGIVPVAWGVAESRKLSGRDFITAVVVGYEVYQRIAMAVQPSLDERTRRGWGLTSWQLFGSLVPAVKLMGHDSLQINKALSMATTCAPIPTNLHEYTKSDVYHFEHGFRNQVAVTLARCAKLGVENLEDGIDDFGAFGTLVTQERHDPSWYTRELGQRYMIMETLLKHWPANMWVQTPVEIVYNIVTKNGIGPEDIEEIIVKPGTHRRMDPVGDGFTSITHAQFNIPFVLAAMLYDRTPGSAWYTPENMRDEKVVALARRVKASDDPIDSPINGFELFQRGDYPWKTMIVKTKDGRTFSESMSCHPGHPANMMDREEISSRFRIQAAPVLSEDRMERALEVLLNLESCEDLSTLDWMLH
ncbi:MmgE/PrpD family protein [uncultured Oscillibacter sp.]|uniref:MmgE/PrpD family protein n=1 Tax=uncultured Oscillibacter sp. TaxID=876091 RepID=UPI0025D28AAE|nr:MmgE/PrpD family protein [uncultured Oscillibacter sp.]